MDVTHPLLPCIWVNKFKILLLSHFGTEKGANSQSETFCGCFCFNSLTRFAFPWMQL